MTNVTKFPGFNAHPGPLAIPAQMTERIQAAKLAGVEVHVVAAIAEKQPEGHWAYTTYWDSQPREVMSWAAQEIVLRARATDPGDPVYPVAG